MKAITLHQPWATLVALRLKAYETRSWKPPKNLIGERIAIHAAKKKPDPEIMKQFMRDQGRRDFMARVPFGKIVCSAVIEWAFQVGMILESTDDCFALADRDTLMLPEGQKWEGGFLFGYEHVKCDIFGNYAEGRWVWGLGQIKMHTPYIETRGYQRTWTVPGFAADAIKADIGLYHDVPGAVA